MLIKPLATGRIAAIGGVLVLLSGCATSKDGTSNNALDDAKLLWTSTAGLSESETKLFEEAKRHATTRLVGGASGAALGCAAGLLASTALADSSGARVAVTAAGCAAGGLAGYAAGNYVAEANRNAAATQANLQGRIAAANADIERYSGAASAAERSVQDLKRDLAELNRQYAARQATVDAFDEEKARLDKSAMALRALIVESEGNIQRMEADIPKFKDAGQTTAALEGRLSALKRENARLVAAYQELITVAQLVPGEAGGPAIS